MSRCAGRRSASSRGDSRRRVVELDIHASAASRASRRSLARRPNGMAQQSFIELMIGRWTASVVRWTDPELPPPPLLVAAPQVRLVVGHVSLPEVELRQPRTEVTRERPKLPGLQLIHNDGCKLGTAVKQKLLFAAIIADNDQLARPFRLASGICFEHKLNVVRHAALRRFVIRRERVREHDVAILRRQRNAEDILDAVQVRRIHETRGWARETVSDAKSRESTDRIWSTQSGRARRQPLGEPAT